MVITTMYLQFSMLNTFHPNRCHLKGRAIIWWAACFMLVCLCNRSRIMRRSCSSHKSICTGLHSIISQSRTGWEVREAMLYWPWNELLLSETKVCCLESSLVFHKILLCAFLKSLGAMLSKLMVAYYFTSYLIFCKFPTDQKLLQVIELFFCMTCGWLNMECWRSARS